MAEKSLLDLVRNGTMDAEVAATLSAIAEEKRSFKVVAVPRFAGKTTVANAMLGFVPRSVPLHYLSGCESEIEDLRQHPDGGYLVVGEFSKGQVPTYIWGSPVRKVFETLRAGFSLSVCLHASSVEEAYAAVCRGNGVADEDAALISYMVYIERMGTDANDFWRRVAGVYEIDRVTDGVPHARLLHRWNRESDQFELLDRPQFLSMDGSVLTQRAQRLQRLVDAGRTSQADVETLRIP
jgi:hypothetical protein